MTKSPPMPSKKIEPEVDGRETKQKQAIRESFESAERPLSPEEVLAEARRHVANIGIATVYRGIKALVGNGWLETVEIPGEPARYEISGKGHHHHFHCRTCGKVYDLGGCSDVVGVRVPKGFRVSGHHLTLLGFCAVCTANTRPAASNKKRA